MKMTETPEEAYRDLMEGTLEMAENCGKEERPYMHQVLGKDFVVLPDVFSPKYFRDTEFFAREVPKRAGREFLEIGAATGIVTCCSVLDGNVERAVATDINPAGVANSKMNALLHGIDEKVEVVEGSVYLPIKLVYKPWFDTIFWNVPFGDLEVENPDELTRSVFDPGQRNLREYILDARMHLRAQRNLLGVQRPMHTQGNLLIGYSTTLGKYEVLEQLLEEAGFTPPELVAESGYVRDGNPRRPVKYELFEARVK